MVGRCGAGAGGVCVGVGYHGVGVGCLRGFGVVGCLAYSLAYHVAWLPMVGISVIRGCIRVEFGPVRHPWRESSPMTADLYTIYVFV